MPYDPFQVSKELKSYFQFDRLPVDWDGLPDHNRIKASQFFGQSLLDYSRFGLKGHNGIDFAFPKGTPIYAPCDMFITHIRKENQDAGYGNAIFAETAPISFNREIVRLELSFGHLLKFKVKEGMFVKAGEIIATGDSTGFSTGNHLHFGTRLYVRQDQTTFVLDNYENGYLGYIDPAPLFKTKIRWTVGEINDRNELLKRIEGKYAMRTQALGQVYKIEKETTTFYDSNKGSDSHIPLVDEFIREMVRQKRLVTISEKEFNMLGYTHK